MIEIDDDGIYYKEGNRVVKLRTVKPKVGDNVLILKLKDGSPVAVKPAPINLGDQVISIKVENGTTIAIAYDEVIHNQIPAGQLILTSGLEVQYTIMK